MAVSQDKITLPVKKLTFGYWAIRGLSAPARMMALAAGLDMDVRLYHLKEKAGGGYEPEGVSWHDGDKLILREKNPMINLPYVCDPDGTVVTQSQPVYMYIARKCGMMGSTPAEQIKCEQALAEIYDLRNAFISVVYGPKDAFDAKFKDHIDKVCMGHLEKIEAFMTTNGTKFAAGDKPTVADFHIWEMADCHDMARKANGLPSLFDSLPKIKVMHAEIKAMPQLKAYFEDPTGYKLPVNNMMAHFK